MEDANPYSCFCVKLRHRKSKEMDAIETWTQEMVEKVVEGACSRLNEIMREKGIPPDNLTQQKWFEFLKEQNLVPHDAVFDPK